MPNDPEPELCDLCYSIARFHAGRLSEPVEECYERIHAEMHQEAS